MFETSSEYQILLTMYIL